MVFKRKIKSLILALFALALCGMISACVVDAGTGDNDDVKTDFSMSLSPKVEEIASDGSVELSVAVNVNSAKNNSPAIKWEISAGSDYATLSSTKGEKVTLTGKNTTTDNKSVTVKVTVTVDGTSKSDTATITVKAKAAGGESGGESGGSGSGETGEKVSYTLTFNGSSEVDEADYFTANGITSGRLKVNSSGNIVFTTSGAATVTVTSVYSNTTASSSSQWGIFKDSSATATVSGPVHNNTSTADATEYTESVELSEAGTYKIARNSDSSKEFFIYKVVVTEVSGSSGSGSGGSESGGSGSGESGGETGSNVISKNDTPTGFANIDVSKMTKTVTVSTKADFKKYVEAGGYIVYVSGTIDLSEGMLPTEAGGSTSALDAFVKAQSGGEYTSYKTFIDAYTNSCSSSTDHGTNPKKSSWAACTVDGDTATTLMNQMWYLNTNYGTAITIKPKSNTMVIGLDENAEIYGGCFNISSVNNVAVRNVKIRDAYDPFPHHEKGDGFNAQHDCIVIQGTSYNIWIDHCTLQDSYHCAKAANGEKFQTYDGLLDMKNNTYNLTVSYCKFQDHDKTMLIGSSSSDGSNETRTITLHHNYFLNCGQRLPMVRNTKLHNFNNYYDTDANRYWTQQYAVGVRENALIVSENNYFGTGVKYSYKDSDGTLYHSGDIDNSSNKITTTTVTSTKPFTPTYSYTPDAAADLPTLIPENAGAGVWNVVQ